MRFFDICNELTFVKSFAGSAVKWIPSLPIYLQNAMMFHTSNSHLFVCGGIDSNGLNAKSCYTYTYSSPTYQLWQVWKSLLDFRLDSAHMVIFKKGNKEEEVLWITGGITSGGAVTDQTEMITVHKDGQLVTDSSWAVGDSLKYALAGHCIAKLADDVALIAGGYGFNLISTSQSLMYNASIPKPNDPWTDLSSMNTPRRNHLCTKYDLNSLVTVLAVGGYDVNDDLLDTVEIFYMVNQLWSVLTKVLPSRISSTALVNLNNRIHLLGGILETTPQRIVWVYHSATGWRRSSLSLEHELQDHVAFSIKSSEVTFKEHPMVLVVGGQLEDTKRAPTELFCAIKQSSYGLDDFCDVDVSETYAYSMSTIFNIFLHHFNTFLQLLFLVSVVDHGLDDPMVNPILWQHEDDFVACGGVLSRDIFDTQDFGIYTTYCQRFSSQTRSWNLLPDLMLSDVRNASAFSHHKSKGSGWITGGFKYSLIGDKNILRPLKSTERLMDGLTLEPGVDLPFTLAGHCSVHVGGDVFFFTGGFKHDFKIPSKDSFIQDWETGGFEMMPEMIHPRGYHTCFALRMEKEQDFIVVVAGGGTSKIETYSFKDNSWKEAMDFCDNDQCFEYLGAKSVVSSDSVLLFGSLQDLADDTMITGSYIFLFQCSTGRREECTLEKVNYQLRYPRMHYSVLTINIDVQDHSEYVSNNQLLDLSTLKTNTDTIQNGELSTTLFKLEIILAFQKPVS